MNLSGKILKKIWYHGTPDGEMGKSICSSGKIIPRTIEKSKDATSPMPGRIYLTKDIWYGVIYSLYGNFFGKKMPKSMVEGSRYGYLFAVHNSELKNVLPDEDVVGEITDIALSITHNKPISDSIMAKRIFNRIDDPEIKLLIQIAENELSLNEKKSLMGSKTSDLWASGGKKMLKILPSKVIKYILNIAPSISNQGSVHPFRAWIIDKTKTQDVKIEDLSSLISIMKKVNIKENFE